jgi:glycosyltransferase involved in cell wall biosynthesis
LDLLTNRGWSCRVFCGPHLDFEDGRSVTHLLRGQGIPFDERAAMAGPIPFSLLHLQQGGIPVAVYDTPAARSYSEPAPYEGVSFLALLDRLLDQVQPDILLTYGGHWLGQEIMAHAQRRGSAVVFSLRNLEYRRAELFRPVDAVLVPSRFAQVYYRRALGLACTAIPGPWDWARVHCPEVQGRYVTFVNPQPEKGVFIFARIVRELAHRRPDIPLLVVEGRGGAEWLERAGLDRRTLGNLYVMRNTPDPRDFYRVSRLVLVPSLWQESFARVAVEALINGIPVLASTRGGMPEVLEQAGFLFPVPGRYTPTARVLPTAEEVAPWVETIIRLWDDAAFYEQEQRRCQAAAEAWRPERLAPRFEEFFARVLQDARRRSRPAR